MCCSVATATRVSQAAIVAGAAGIAFVAKVILAATTVGTNDVIAWQQFSQYVVDNDSVSIYNSIASYNHPPPMSLWLGFIGTFAAERLRLFAFLIRLPAIVADVGSVLLVWELSRRYCDDRRAIIGTVVFALSPVLILVSGFHGNTDPVFMFLLLATVYSLGVKNRYVLGGVLFGLSLWIKIVPLVMIPAFFLWSRSSGQSRRFFGSAFAVVALGYCYHLIHAFDDLLRNVVAYGSLNGIWGIGRIIPGYETIGRVVAAVAVTGAAWVVLRSSSARHPRGDRLSPLLLAFATTFLTFLVVTPGFGVQYLSWLVAPAVFIGLALSVTYNILAGWFLGVVYAFWSGGWPLYFANSRAAGQWRGSTIVLEQILWSVLLVALIAVVREAAAGKSGEGLRLIDQR